MDGRTQRDHGHRCRARFDRALRSDHLPIGRWRKHAGRVSDLRRARAAEPARYPRDLPGVAIRGAGGDEVSDVVDATLASFIEREQQESLSMAEALLREVHTNGLAAVGTEATLQALRQGQADVVVLGREHDLDAKEEIVNL